MTSATLSVDRNRSANGFLSMFLWSLKKNKALIIVYSALLLFSCPVIMLISGITQLAEGNAYINIAEVSVAMFAVLTTICVFLMTLIVAPMMFDYLHNKRKSDLYGAMPCSRRTLFFSRYLTGLAIVIVPYLLNMLIVALSDACLYLFHNGAADLDFVKGYDAIFNIALMVLTAVISSYTFTAFIALCCGTTANTILCTLLINVSYPIAFEVISVLFSSIIPGVVINFDSNIFIIFLLSPYLSCIVPLMDYFSFYSSGMSMSEYDYTYLRGYGSELALAALITAAALIGCFFLIKRRKAESAQGSFAFSAPASVIRFIASAGIGLIAALIATSISFSSGGSYYFGDEHVTYSGFTTGDAWAIFFIFILTFIITAFLVHLVATVIFNKGFAGFAKSLISYGVLVGVVTIVYLVLAFGGFGADKYVPQNDEIASVDLSYGYSAYNSEDYYSTVYNISDEASIKLTTELHSNIVENLNSYYPAPYHVCQNNEASFIATYYEEDIAPTQNSFIIESPQVIKLVYHLKDGGTVERKYSSIYYIGIDMGQEIANITLSASNTKLAELEEVVKADKLDITEFELTDNISYYSSYETKYVDNKNMCDKLEQAIKKDFESGAASSKSAIDSNDYLCTLTVRYNSSESSKVVSSQILVPKTYKNTIQFLGQYGFISAARIYDNRVVFEDDEVDLLFSLPDDSEIEKQSYDNTKESNGAYVSFWLGETYSDDDENSYNANVSELVDAAENDSLYCRVIYLGSDGKLYYLNEMYSSQEKTDVSSIIGGTYEYDGYIEDGYIENTVDVYLSIRCDKNDPEKTYTPYIIQFYSKNKKLHTTPINIYDDKTESIADLNYIDCVGTFNQEEDEGGNSYVYLTAY